MRDFLFPDLHLFKDPFNSTAIPGKGGRAPSHGGFRSRSGTINQTPPIPPRLVSPFQTSTITSRGKSAQRRGPGRGALPAQGCGGGAAKPTAAPAPVTEALPRTGGPRRPPPHAPRHEVRGTPGAPPGRRRRLPRPPSRPQPTGTLAGAAAQSPGAEAPRETRSRPQHGGSPPDTPTPPPRAPVRS